MGTHLLTLRFAPRLTGRRQKGLVENKVEEKRKKLELALNNKRDGIDQIFVDYVNSVKSIKQTFTRATNHFMGSYEKVSSQSIKYIYIN